MRKKPVTEDTMRAIAHSVGDLRQATESGKEEVGEGQSGVESAPAGQYWVRGPAHIQNGGLEVVLHEDRAQPYILYTGEGLLFELAALPDGNLRSVLAFVRRYGLLWHGADDLGSGKCRESLETWFEAIGGLRTTVALYQALRESVWIGSTEPLRRLKFEAAMSDEIVSQLTDEIYLAVAHKVIARMITYGLRDAALGIGPNVTDDEDFVPGQFVFSILPSNLLGAAWADLAHIVGARAEIATCPGCGKYFTPESGKQKYCTQSCASTSRWRRWKGRQTQ